jgi:Na+-driven multidrug efflux pump
MVVAVSTMWTVRILLSLAICYLMGMGPLGVWFGMSADFFARSAFYIPRWLSNIWETKRVI